MSWTEDCSAARDAQKAADDARHEVDMLSRTVDSNRWAAESCDENLAARLADVERQLSEALRTIEWLQEKERDR
ncbi:hypothetical protein AB0K21_21680 [Streptosporangium sp. NPDC049248]|uniref:hypothetical protein n=1 Tax=Streptosporangium sp. NPDC049248 TaxID=3155651 RepID=UPI0034356964